MAKNQPLLGCAPEHLHIEILFARFGLAVFPAFLCLVLWLRSEAVGQVHLRRLAQGLEYHTVAFGQTDEGGQLFLGCLGVQVEGAGVYLFVLPAHFFVWPAVPGKIKTCVLSGSQQK